MGIDDTCEVGLLASWPLELAAAAAAGSHRTGPKGAQARASGLFLCLMAERMSSDGMLQVGRTRLGLDRGAGLGGICRRMRCASVFH
jgi:hypothetical protein